MLASVPTDETFMNLIKYIDHIRKVNEKTEEYEICLEMKELSQVFSDYVLGYSAFDNSLINKLYDFVSTFSEISHINNQENSVIFEMKDTGGNFAFYKIPQKEMDRLNMLVTVQIDERSKNRKKKKD